MKSGPDRRLLVYFLCRGFFGEGMSGLNSRLEISTGILIPPCETRRQGGGDTASTHVAREKEAEEEEEEEKEEEEGLFKARRRTCR